MFVRVKATPNSPRKSVQIVKSIRVGNKVFQRIVRYVGIAMDDNELEQLKTLGESICIKLEADNQGSLFSPEELIRLSKKINSKVEEQEDDYRVNLKDLVEEQRITKGIHDIYGKLFDELGYKYIFKNPARQISAVNIVKNIVLARIANPCSKRSSVNKLEEDFGVSLNLQSVYRAMDKIDDKAISKIEEITYLNTAMLFKQRIDVIFFDVTTLYFESFTEDDLRKMGYSKDLKFNQTRVLFSLMVTEDGLPIGYKIFPGNTYEGHTLIPVLKEIKGKYNLDEVIFVADSGMFNEEDLKVLEENDFEYIVRARLKSMESKIRDKILNKVNYRDISEETSIFELKVGSKRLLVSYNKNRALKDSSDRSKAINKLLEKINKGKSVKNFLSNFGYKKYLKISGKSEVVLDEDKITKESEWDGLSGIMTNALDLKVEEILKQYNNLWNIEEAFRVTKHDLKVRPVFHWIERRIKSHLAICFIAFALVKNLEYRIKLQYKKMSPEKIRQVLTNVQTSILYDNRKKIRYGLSSKISQEAKKIYQFMQVSHNALAFIIKKM